MTVLTNHQLNTIRNENQFTQLFLAKYEPSIVFQARINDSLIEKGATDITFDSVVTGSVTAIKEGMTLYIGSSAGEMDIGRVRIRYATGTTITVAPDSNIAYEDDLYLTVKDFHEFWPVFPRAELNTGTLETTHYKDNDIVLTDQNTNFDPVVIMGPDFAGFYDTHGEIYFTATGSYTVDGSTISSYFWQFPTGSSVYTSTNGTPGNVTFPGPGMYTVSCRVVASNGKVSTGYRHIILLNRYAGDHLPITDWKFESLEGAWGGGYIAKVSVRERADEFKDGDLVIIFAEDWYNDSKQSFGGYPGREHILFVGYVSEVENSFNAFDSEHSFILKGMASYMQNKEMFSVQMTDTSNTPKDWTEIKDMNYNRAINHYLRWHTTLLQIADFITILTDEATFKENIIIIDKGELSNNINSLIGQRLFGTFTSDRQGRCYTEIDFNMLATGSRPASVMEFEDRDWVGRPAFIERLESPISNVLIGGESYDPPLNTGTALLSRAPGTLQTYIGKSLNVSGASVASQEHINSLSGLYFAKHNNRYPEIILDLANNMRNIDVVPQEFYDFNIDGDQTHRNIEWNPKRLIPRRISYKLENFVLKATIGFEPETYGPPGDTVIIPTEPPDDGGIDHCDEFPEDCENPCEGDCGEPCINCEATGDKVYVVTSSKLGRTLNFTASSPNWQDITPSFSGSIVDFILDPYDPINTAYLLTTTNLYKTTNLDSNNPSFINLGDTEDIFGTSNTARFTRVKANITAQDLIYVRGYVENPAGLQPDWSYVAHSHDGGNTWTAVNAGNVDDNQPQENYNGFEVGQHGIADVYVTAVGGIIRKSTDHGHSFSNYVVQGGFWGPDDVYCPYGDPADSDKNNPNDDIIWFWGGRQIVNLYRYDPTRGTLDTGEVGGNSANGWGTPGPHKIICATYDRRIVYALKRVNNSPSLFDLIYSDDEGENWTTRQQNLPGARALGLWPYNPNRVFCLESNNIRYSTDGGVSEWLSKNGDWATVMGAPFSGPIMIVPVWVEG